jgi:hypothetical protein
MVKRPMATLQVLRQPHIAPGCKRYEVDCRSSTTGLTWIPGPFEVPEDHLILAAGYEHEERCGECDVSDVLARGDQHLRRLVDESWPRIVGAMVRRGRRN